MGMKSEFIAFLISLFSGEVVTFLLAASPIFELRLAVPMGILYFKLPLLKVYLLCLVGNMVPVLPLLFFFKYFFHRLIKVRFMGRFFRWWFNRVAAKSKVVEKWGFWGLAFFVALPLPVTGAWTGTVAATLCELPIRRAFTAILIGISMAGIVMTVLSLVAGGPIMDWLIALVQG